MLSIFMLASCAAHSSPPVVYIEHYVDDNWEFLGSGTFIKSSALENYAVVTAYHVIENEEFIRVCNLLRYCVQPTEGFHIEGVDVAVLTVDEKLTVPTKIGKSLDFGQELYSVSFPGGHYIESDSKVMGIWDTYDFLLSGFCAPGSSGGGVFDKAGRLVGVIVGIPILEVYGTKIYDTHLCIVSELYPTTTRD